MLHYILKSLQLLFFSILICCGAYTITLLILGQTFFPFQANGCILPGPDGKPVGSALIAQSFTKDEYFQPRPSAASYDASASAASALAASNHELRDRVARALAPLKTNQNVPADMITASASGLDPHITMQTAMLQLDRVAEKWANHLNRNPQEVKGEIAQLIREKTVAPMMGLSGEEIINVLEINLELHKKYGTI